MRAKRRREREREGETNCQIQIQFDSKFRWRLSRFMRLRTVGEICPVFLMDAVDFKVNLLPL